MRKKKNSSLIKRVLPKYSLLVLAGFLAVFVAVGVFVMLRGRAAGPAIPDTSYAIPAGAIFMSPSGNDASAGTKAAPVRTLARAIALAPSGGTIVLRGGVYRDGLTGSVFKRLTFQPYPHEQAWLDGTDVTSGWQSAGSGLWSLSWSTPSFCAGHYYDVPYSQQRSDNSGPCTHMDMSKDPSNPAAGDPQMIFVDGNYVPEVTSKPAAAGSGKFYYDHSARKLYLGMNPSGRQVEVTARPVALVLQGGSGATVRGLGFRRYATNEFNGNTTHGAVLGGEPNVVFENNLFMDQAGAAISYSDPRGGVVRSNVFYRNGFNGLDANGHFRSRATDNFVVENNTFDGNNRELFGTNCSASCAAAGAKFAHMVGFTLRNNIFQNGQGKAKGFWCDLACSNGVMVNNIVRNNDTGLYYEVSDTGIIASNLIYGNRGYGLKMGSANTKVYNNTFASNGTNALIYDDNRSYGVGGWTDVGPDTKNVLWVNNVLSGGGMVSAWRTSSTGSNTGPNKFFAAFDFNSYYRPGGSPGVLVDWRDGATSSYTSLASFRGARGKEGNGHDIVSGGDPFFVNAGAGDYRVRSGSAAYRTGAPLPADVAGAVGIAPGMVVDRGALAWPGRGAGGASAPAPAPAPAKTPIPASAKTPAPVAVSAPAPRPAPASGVRKGAGVLELEDIDEAVGGVIDIGVDEGEKVTVKVDGTVVSTDGELDTTYLTNGIHEITVEKTAANGTKRVTSRKVDINNKLSPWQVVRNSLFAPFHGNKSMTNGSLVLMALVMVVAGVYIATRLYRKRGSRRLSASTLR